jgi:3-deoxy-7-phosphoheptulonate synthase
MAGGNGSEFRFDGLLWLRGRMIADAMLDSWTPGSWRDLPAAQQPDYPDPSALAEVEDKISHAAPIVEIADCVRLRTLAARVAQGNGFILQGGDCAETLGQNPVEAVAAMAGLFDRLTGLLGRDTIRIGRIAGQFAKPRSSKAEIQGDVCLPPYRGDGINAAAFDADGRRPDPRRMLAAHAQSLATAIALRRVSPPIFASHEALLLPYEQAQVSCDATGRWWSTSGHMLWVGDRTRAVDGAHVHFLSGIDNLVGVKAGPTLGPDALLALVDRLNPGNAPGKLAMICRLGSDAIAVQLPRMIRAARREGRSLLWMVDPMHGNSRIESDRKVRRFADIIAETEAFFAIAEAEGIHPAGLHVEMSPDNVTECIGDAGPDDAAGMGLNFQSLCDPRLNAAQAEQLVRMVAARA